MSPQAPQLTEPLFVPTAEARRKRSGELKNALLTACKNAKLVAPLDGKDVEWREQNTRDAFCEMVPEDRAEVYAAWTKVYRAMGWKPLLYFLLAGLVLNPRLFDLFAPGDSWLKVARHYAFPALVIVVLLMCGVAARKIYMQSTRMRRCLDRLRVCMDFPVD